MVNYNVIYYVNGSQVIVANFMDLNHYGILTQTVSIHVVLSAVCNVLNLPYHTHIWLFGSANRPITL